MAKYALLSVESDAKTVKGSKDGVLTAILYLAPATEADGVHQMCPGATNECIKACLHGSGMSGVYPSIKRRRVEKTLQYIADSKAFEDTLVSDVARLAKEAKSRGMVPAVRINGTSDQPQLARRVAERCPTVQFYDYTKIPQPWKRTTPNYHLTFSHSGENLSACMAALKHGVNVAVVFAGALPETWHGYRVISGDTNDLRFRDPVGVIVGLTVKANAGTRSMSTGGFIQIGKVA